MYKSIFDDEQASFHVVVNDEEQYSIWPQALPVPPGWRSEGTSGDRATCLAYIEETWKDMRPRSLREAMDADGT